MATKKKTVAIKNRIQEAVNSKRREKQMMNEAIRNASSTRANFMQKLFDERRDIDVECGYPEEISIEMYKKMFAREGVAKRVVKLMPEESWIVDPKIMEDEKTEETVFEKAWNELQDEKNLYQFLARGDVLSGIGCFGILFLGFSDGEVMEKSVPGINERGEKEGNTNLELLYIRTFDQSVVTVQKKEEDPDNPRFGQPTLYQISFLEVTDTASTTVDLDSVIPEDQKSTGEAKTVTRLVHWTRIIHLADNREMSEIFGVPRMQPVFNRIMDVRKVLSGSGEMFWKGAFPGYSFELLPQAAEAGATVDADSLATQFEDYQNGLQRYLALTGMTAKSLAPQVADPTAHMTAIMQNMAVTLNIPLRILLGSEQAKLASTQDKETWNGRVAYRQNKYLTPMEIRPFIDRLIMVGVLPEPKQYMVKWPDLNTSTEIELAEVADKKTQALAKYVGGGVDSIIPPSEYLTIIMEMDPKEVKVIMEAAGTGNNELDIDEDEAAAALADEERILAVPGTMGEEGSDMVNIEKDLPDWWTINEKRRFNGQPDIPGGNVIVQSSNEIPAFEFETEEEEA